MDFLFSSAVGVIVFLPSRDVFLLLLFFIFFASYDDSYESSQQREFKRKKSVDEDL